MAASGLLPDQSSVLKEELTCPVCLDVYRDPHLLPCGHNFCLPCLRRLKRQADRGRFRCPECRESHRYTISLQKNFKLANIAEDYRQRGKAAAAAAAAAAASASSSSSSGAAASSAHGAGPSSSSSSSHWVQPPLRAGSAAVLCDYCAAAAAEAPPHMGRESPALGAEARGDEPPGAAASSSSSTSRDVGDVAVTAGPSSTVTVASATSSSSSSGPEGRPLAVKMCLKCEVSMCQEHVKPHLELPAFREHVLTDPIAPDDFRRRKCQEHDKMYSYYCMDEKMLVCNACAIEGGHKDHTIKTLRNTMKDLKKGSLTRQLIKVERKYTWAERKLQEQKEKERQNRKFMEDSEECMSRLREEMQVIVDGFVLRLQHWTQLHCDANGPAILKNISRICQDEARLQEVRVGVEGLMSENDPFRFIEAYKTTGKQCRRQLRKSLFYPEYINMETDVLGVQMEEEMRKLLESELHAPIIAAIDSLCNFPVMEEEEEQEENDEEGEEEEEDEDDDDLDDSSEEEEEDMRSDEEEEELAEEQEEEEEEGQDQSESADDVYTPEEEEEEEEEEDEDEEGEEEEEDDEDEVIMPPRVRVSRP